MSSVLNIISEVDTEPVIPRVKYGVTPKVGMKFKHRRVLDASTMKPADYVVTKIANGVVYYKQPGDTKAKDYTSTEDFWKIVKDGVTWW
jgi:hypothetical protein